MLMLGYHGYHGTPYAEAKGGYDTCCRDCATSNGRSHGSSCKVLQSASASLSCNLHRLPIVSGALGAPFGSKLDAHELAIEAAGS